jgi:predicted DsbA family dithiol-disulfide isomerase
VAAVKVEIVSDVVCPWCYIGKRRFEKAIDDMRHAHPDRQISVSYRAFQLDPTAPMGNPTPVMEAYARRFGSERRAAEIIGHVSSLAAAEGIDFQMTRALRANTLPAHRLIKFVEAHASHLQAALNEALMKAYFVDGLDIANSIILASLAQDAGFDHPQLDSVLAWDGSDDEWSKRVDLDIAWATERDITAVPTFVVNDVLTIPGAQDTATFVRILSKMAER